MRVRVSDVIEPAALRRAATWPIVNFNFRQYKVSRGINDHTMRYEPKVYRSEQYNCQMNELMFNSSRCKRNERAKRAHSLYIYTMSCDYTCMQNSLHCHCHSESTRSVRDH